MVPGVNVTSPKNGFITLFLAEALTRLPFETLMALQSKNGTVLLQVRTRLSFALLWTLGGLAMTLGTSVSLFTTVGGSPKQTTGGALGLIAGIVFGASMLIVGIRELRNRTVLFEVTDRGVLVKPVGGAWIWKEILVPWERVLAMRYLDRGNPDIRTRRSGFNVGSTPVIALKVRMDSGWPPPGTLKHVPWAEIQDEIYLLAWEGSANRKELFRQMEEIRAKHSRLMANQS